MPPVTARVTSTVWRVSKDLSPVTLLGWLSAILVAFTLAACGDSGAVQTAKTDHYTIQLGLNGTGFGERVATIQILDEAGQPASVEQIVIVPVMEQMGMASPEVAAQPLSSGYYQAKGEFFPMIGEWTVRVRVSAGGNEEVATFKFQVTQ